MGGVAEIDRAGDIGADVIVHDDVVRRSADENALLAIGGNDVAVLRRLAADGVVGRIHQRNSIAVITGGRRSVGVPADVVADDVHILDVVERDTVAGSADQ
jgi:hypothetical protein